MKAKMKRAAKQTSTPIKLRRSRADRAAAKQFMALLKTGGDTRIKKVKRVRASVRSRAYENDLKLSIAVERLARELSA